MKIAVCVSGHLRKFEELKHNFYGFLDVLKQYGIVDVFVATWDKQNAKSSWSKNVFGVVDNLSSNNINNDKVKSHYSASQVSVYDEDFYSSSYSTLNYKLLTDGIPQNTMEINLCQSNNIFFHSKQFFLIYNSNLLKCQSEFANDARYDLVFRVRPDFLFDVNKINQIKFDNLNLNKLYVNCSDNCMDDQFAFSSSHIMNIYSNVFLKYSEQYNKNIFYNPETILTNTIMNNHKVTVHDIPKLGLLYR